MQAVDSIALVLSQRAGKYSAAEYKANLINARKEKTGYFLLAKDLDFMDAKAIKECPLLRKGRNKGGLIIKETDSRLMPFDGLGERTFGYTRQNAKSIGIEGKFDEYLKGEELSQVEQLISGNEWIAVYEIDGKPQNGNDVITTIDIRLQDIADKALHNSLIAHDAMHGCVVVMEVKTGKVKAMVNLGKNEGRYYEDYNYAIGERYEPGSTFKVPVMLSLIKDKKVEQGSFINVKDSYKYRNLIIKDEHVEFDSLSIKQAISHSSNEAMVQLITKAYENQPNDFFKNLSAMHLDRPTGIELEGENPPFITTPDTKQWTSTTLPVMSFGYGLQITPLQNLTFYNAIANDGVVMKPYLISEIRKGNESLRRFAPSKLGEMCTAKEAELIQDFLEDVVVEGTAMTIKNANYKLAGKTGTAIIPKNGSYKNPDGYNASFVGYFPADNPIYSCIVCVHKPSKGSYYGANAAAPVFKEIAEKYLSIEKDFIESSQAIACDGDLIPLAKNGHKMDLGIIYSELDIRTKGNPIDVWALTKAEEKSVRFENNVIAENKIPNVKGMGLRDAIFLLENLGLKVVFNGKGKVKRQYPEAGATLIKENVISLELS